MSPAWKYAPGMQFSIQKPACHQLEYAMNEKTVFVRTSSGEDEVRSRTAHLSKDIKRALLMVDGTATVAEIMRRASPSLRGMLEDMFTELTRGGFIQDKAKATRSSPLVTPSPLPPKKALDDEVDELDFTSAFRVPTPAMLAEEAARVARVEAERQAAQTAERARQDAEEAARVKAEQQATARVVAEQEAEQARRRAESARHEKEVAEAQRAAEQARTEAIRAAAAQEKARLQAEVTELKAQAEAEARARAEAEKRARQVAEAARLQAEKLAREAVARIKAEHEAAEAARLQAEQLAREAAERIRAEQAAAEAARQQAEQMAREAAERIKAEKAAAEAVRRQAEQMAREAARIKAEHDAASAAVRAEDERAAKEATEARLRAEQHAAEVKAEAEAHAHAVAQEKARLEAEVAKLKALAEAETQARIEATAQAKKEAEAARVKAEQQAALARDLAEQAARAAAEAEVRIDAERAARQAEVARVQAEHDAAIVRAEEQARAQAQAHAEEQLAEFIAGEAVRAEAARLLQEQNLAQQATAAAGTRDPGQWVARGDSADRRKTAAAVPGCDSRGGNNGVPVVERRTTTAAVVFFDIVGYTKLPDSRQIELKKQFTQLVTDSLDPLDAGERIILDTGDGAAIGFLQHPTDALESAMHFRKALVADKHYEALRVRIGIHLGPVSLVKDMNGQINMLGDGINSAQRVMSFAGQNQIYVSRAYFEFVSNLSDEYNDSFRYRGAQQDKHGREHQVYELLGAEEPPEVKPVEPSSELAAFNFDAFNVGLSLIEEPEAPEGLKEADQLLQDAVGLVKPETIEPAVPPFDQAAPVEQPVVEKSLAEKPAVETPVEEPQYTAAETKELADAQAKKWEEAKLRVAKQNARIFEQPVAVEVPVEKPVALPPRKPLPWGRLVAGLLVLLLAALFVVPVVLPMQAYLTGIEQLLSAKLKQPVHIAHLEGRILPTPRLLLDDVSVGDVKQIKVRRVQVGFSYFALLGQIKPVSSLELDGVEVSAFSQVPIWLQQLASDPEYPVSRIVLTQGKLDADGIDLTDVSGELDFDHGGKFTEAKLNANAHKLDLEIHATPEQKLQLVFSLREGALPTLPNWVFEDLKATGELSRDELRITDLDGRIMGGALTGDMRINWRSGWRVQGTLAAKVIPLQNINKLLSGDLDGSARFQMQAKSLDKLVDAAILNGVFNVRKGLISGVDLVETARLRSRESLPGGRTHFDELSGELFYANDVYQFRPVKMNDSVVKVAGTLTVNRQQLSGNVIADLTMRGGMGSVALQVGGTTASPTLHAAR